MAKFDLITVGACGIDILLDIHNKTGPVKFNKSQNEIVIKSGSKILMDGYKFACGQNAANVSVGASRLGLSTSIYAEIGSDDFSKKILETLNHEQVDVSNIKIEKGDSSFSIIIDFQNERTILAEIIKKEHDFSFKNVSADFLYLTSLSKNWINAYIETLNFVSNNNIPFAFNPGTAQIEDNDKIILEVIKKSKILFVSRDEAESLLSQKRSFTEINEKSYIKKLLHKFKDMGTSNVVITDGKNGSYCLDQKNRTFYLNALLAQVVEMTGAGDAYASGFLYGYMNNEPTETSMVYGALNASSVIGYVGSQEGLLSSDILKEKAKQLENFRPVII